MRKHLIHYLLGGLALVIVAASIFWYLNIRAISVATAQSEKDVTIQVFGLGTIEAQSLSKIGFETAGTLVELNADYGDTVKTGTVMARLQSREQEARVLQAKAALSQARSGVEQAAAAVEKAEVVLKQKDDTNVRRQQLVKNGVVSQEAAGDTQAAVDVAKAELNQAVSAVSVARSNLDQAAALLTLEEARLAKYTLSAPFDGIVMARHKELGSALNANESVFTIVDPATVWALAYIDEARAGSIEVGQPAIVTRRSAPDRKMNARVVRIDMESDRVNEERRVYVRCGSCPLAFHLGEQAEVLIAVATLPHARMVKTSSLISVKGREALAWTVEKNRLQQRVISLGQRTLDGRVEILGGLPEGAEVVDGLIAGLKIGRRATIELPKDKGQ